MRCGVMKCDVMRCDVNYLVDAEEDVAALVRLPELRRAPGDVGVRQLGGDDRRLDAAVHGLDRHASPVVKHRRVTLRRRVHKKTETKPCCTGL